MKRNVSVHAFVHKEENTLAVQKLGVTDIVVGELSHATAVSKALKGIDAVFYIASAVLENEAEVGKQFVAAAKQAGVRPVVFPSVIHPVLSELVNHADKAPVEEALFDSGMKYVFRILRYFSRTSELRGRRWRKLVYGEPWSTESRFKYGSLGWHTFRHAYRSWLDDTGAPTECSRN